LGLWARDESLGLFLRGRGWRAVRDQGTRISRRAGRFEGGVNLLIESC
jgi:hypothetical protein